MVLGVMLAGCGGGTASEGEPSPTAQSTAGTAAGGDSSSRLLARLLSHLLRRPLRYGRRRLLRLLGGAGPGGTGTGSASVGATSEPAEATREALLGWLRKRRASTKSIMLSRGTRSRPFSTRSSLMRVRLSKPITSMSRCWDCRSVETTAPIRFPILSQHEIVNDVVGGKPVAVTW